MSYTKSVNGTNPHAQVQDCYPVVRPRNKRPTLEGKPVLKATALAISALGILLAVLAIVWGAAVLVTGKADHEDVDQIDRKVQTIRVDVEVIKTEQRMLIRALAPQVKVGKE